MRNVACGILFLISVVVGQTISLSGKVTNSGGTAIEGAVVKLFVNAMACTTKADGMYALSGTVGTIGTMPGLQPRGMVYKSKSFVVTADAPVPAEVRLYDCAGRMVAGIFSGLLPKGITRIPFAMEKLGKKVYMLRVRMGAESAAYTLVPTSDKIFTVSAASLTDSKLLKVSAGPTLDWLQGSKTGYTANIQPLSSLSGVINITLTNVTAPNFGNNVKIFDPSMQMSSIQSTMDGLKNASEMSTQRTAFLFKPGTYSVTVPVQYYIHAMGMGMSPDDVNINGEVRSDGQLIAFWRCAENMSANPPGGNNQWAVSQAAPFRRMHIKGRMTLSAGSASGGYFSDCKIDGQISPGSQQQFYFRNCQLNGWQNSGMWNFLFHGVVNAPADRWPSGPEYSVTTVPLVREKPFLIIDNAGNYSVFVPALRTNSQGTTWYNATPAGVSIPIDQFYIAQAGADNATTINAALAQGKNLLLTPGIYNVTAPIQVLRPNTVVLGLGLPSIVSQNGNGGIKVADVDGVTIAGLMFDASGTTELPVQLQIGDTKTSVSHAANPTFLYDIFCRIGGYVAGKVSVNVLINSNNVVFDHCWIWRADHGTGVGWTSNVSKNGMIINGDDVICYGQFMEHHHQYQTIWKGERGRNYFFQCETPYDAQNWTHDGIRGYAGYKVGDSVTTHEAWSLGVYLFFNPGADDNAIEVPKMPGVKMHRMFTFGAIAHVCNGVGSGRLLEYP
jgi:hypothetical protein